MLSPCRYLPPRKAAVLHLGHRRCGKDVPPLVQPSAAPTGARHRPASISRNQRRCVEPFVRPCELAVSVENEGSRFTASFKSSTALRMSGSCVALEPTTRRSDFGRL